MLMGFPLQSLRNWIPFSAPEAEDAEAAALRQWLDRHAHASAGKIAIGLANRVPVLAAKQKNLHMRVHLLDMFLEAAEGILASIEDEICRASLPLPSEVQANALAADNLVKALASSYGAVVSAIESRRLGTGLSHLLQSTIQNTMRLIARRQALAYRAYAYPSPGSWLQLHQFHAIARARNLALTTKDGRNIEDIYVRSLLLALADPTKRSRNDLDTIGGCIDSLLPLAHLTHLSSLGEQDRKSKSLFLLQASEGCGSRPLSKVTSLPPIDALALDTREVVAELTRNLRRPNPTVHCPPELVESMIHMWSSPPTRRFTRSRVKPKADLVSGIPSVAKYLQSAFTRRQSDTPNHPSMPVSEWYIVNESPDGFGLRYSRGDPGSFDVGDLVGVRPRERSRVHICLIRRVSNSGHGRFELGVQELSPLALPIPLAADPNSNARDAILLPRLPGFGNVSGLAAPAGILFSGGEVIWSRNNLSFRHQLGRRIEGNHRTELFLLA
jgi:cyclic-di-GMP-binding protein